MWELIGAIVFGCFIVGAVRIVAFVKIHMLDVQQTFQERFFSCTREIVEWEDISDKRLVMLSVLSSTIRSRKMQMRVFQVLKKTQKEGTPPFSQEATYGDSLDAERLKVWGQTFGYWMAAVCAQGSVSGIVCLLEFVKTFGSEKITSKTEGMLLSEELTQPVH